jgi:hypothetical protein
MQMRQVMRPSWNLLGLTVLSVALVCGGPVREHAAHAQTATPEATSPAPACLNPVDYGAIPDDGQDDRVPTQQAINDAIAAGGGEICWPMGQFDYTRAPSGGPNRLASLDLSGAKNVRLRGAGPGTVLRMLGDGGQGTWYLMNVRNGSEGIWIGDLSLDSTGAFNTEEQTHLIQIGGAGTLGVTGVQIERVRFFHPALAGRQAGDCIRLVGEVARPVRQIGIHGNWFQFCDRSGIGVQRASYEVTVTGNLFAHVIDQAIDFEPTGTGSVGDYTITGNVFTTGADAQGPFEVTIVGIGGADLAFRVVFAHNVLKGRGLQLFNVRRAVIEGNVIESVLPGPEAVLTVQKLEEEWIIANNVLARLAGSPPGSVVRIIHHGSGTSTRGLLQNNQITQEVDGSPIAVESARDLTVSGNDVAFLGPTAGTYMGFDFRTTIQPGEGVLITGNRFKGALRAAIRLASSPEAMGAVAVTSNLARGGVQYVLRCENGSGFTKPVLLTGNYGDGVAGLHQCLPAAGLVSVGNVP